MEESEQGHERMKIYAHVMGVLSCTGGVLYVMGSLVYMPAIATYFNPNLGGILFIMGSLFLFSCDILGHFEDPIFSPFHPFRNIGCLRCSLVMMGNLSFTVGSVFFIPALPAVVGIDIFVVGSIFIWIPQMLACVGLYMCNSYTAEYYYQMIPYRQTIIVTNLLLALGCLFFAVGSILFYDQNSETIGLFEEGVVMFIVGSTFFTFGAGVGVVLRNHRVTDPLQQYRDNLKETFSKQTPLK